MRTPLPALLAFVLGCTLASVAPALAQTRTSAEILQASTPQEWRTVDPANLLVMRLASGGEVLIELADVMAPQAARNIRTLVGAGYFDGLAILRVQDNYVTQWGDPNSGKPAAKALGAATPTVAPEWSRPRAALPFTPIPDRDAYAPEVGFIGGFPAGRDTREAWLAHCYGMVGVGRDTAPDSGSGAELYVVIGHAPRHLDRNITLVGRVLEGMPHLSALPRGSGQLGFYTETEPKPGIASVRLASSLPDAPRLQALRTDSPSFAALIEARRKNSNPWFHRSADAVELCNVGLPVRRAAPTP
jgi:peptidylprolyl isomerase